MIREKTKYRTERGFTLLETLLVVGLTTLIAVGVIAGLVEGLDTLSGITDAQNVEFGHQRAMELYVGDVQAAQWFYSGTVHSESGSVILRDTLNPYFLAIGYPGPDGDEIWVRYRTRPGVLSGETYLIRTVVSDNPALNGSSVITTGVANLEFIFYDQDGLWTDQANVVRRIDMVLSINAGGATIQRDYDVTMRSPNRGVKDPVGDFDEIENEALEKSIK
ncbi:MAG: hypothetical protein ABIC40_08815 [bacterium]